jgi:hypothetical protein
MCEGLVESAYHFIRASVNENDINRMDDIVVQVEPTTWKVSPSNEATGKVVITIPEGKHLCGPFETESHLTATSVKVKDFEATVTFPECSGNRYVGKVEIPITIALEGEKPSLVELSVSWQLCSETECYGPQTKTIRFKLD